MMLTKRLWFRKEGPAKYISHLDLSRYLTRVFRKAKLPLWYTEGFHPHAFLVFTLPLSLGMTGVRESVDIRLTEEMSREEILRRLNTDLAAGISFFDVTEPVKKAGDVSFASYVISYASETASPAEIAEQLRVLGAQEEVLVEKRTKSGVKPFDLSPYLRTLSVSCGETEVQVACTLPAGSRENISPKLLGDALRTVGGIVCTEQIERTEMFDANRKSFR